MKISTIDESQRKAANVAGFTYLFTLAMMLFVYFGIQSRLIVAGNAAETARNIMAHEPLFRVNVACDLIYCAGVVVLLTALYVILKPVNRSLALLAAFWRLVYALIWILIALDLLNVLRLLSGADYLRAFGADRLQALARLYLGSPAYSVGLPFYGLASTICGYLWFKSNYIPRALSAWGVISSVWCVTCAFAFIVFPYFAKVVNPWWFDSPMGSFEMAMSFWLLFKGLRTSA
jgi:hypothetical protein